MASCLLSSKAKGLFKHSLTILLLFFFLQIWPTVLHLQLWLGWQLDQVRNVQSRRTLLPMSSWNEVRIGQDVGRHMIMCLISLVSCSDEFPGLCKGVPLTPLTVRPPVREHIDFPGQPSRPPRPETTIVMPPIIIAEPEPDRLGMPTCSS